MADEGKRPVCAVVGVGPGNGEAIARRFAADGYSVALMARRTELTAKLAGELPLAKSYACDVTEAASVEAAFAAMRSDLGDVDALIYNAGSGVWGNVEEVKAEDLERSWRVNTLGLFLTGQQAIPAMRRKGQGAIIVVGATASRRGAAGAAAFAQSKMAQRALAESMAPPSLAGGHPCRADRRRRRGRRAGDALASWRSSRRFLHRSSGRRCDRRRPRQTGSLRLEFRGRSPAVQGEVVRARHEVGDDEALGDRGAVDRRAWRRGDWARRRRPARQVRRSLSVLVRAYAGSLRLARTSSLTKASPTPTRSDGRPRNTRSWPPTHPSEAVAFGPICRRIPPRDMAEDCISLNVWTPEDAINGARALPVMLFIHGGAFVKASAPRRSMTGARSPRTAQWW